MRLTENPVAVPLTNPGTCVDGEVESVAMTRHPLRPPAKRRGDGKLLAWEVS